MERLTTTQINDFNNPLAFARERTVRVGQTDTETRETQNFRTKDREASFRLVTGASKRLETLKGNLETMLDLSRSGERISNNSYKREEIYGKLRSLSAGFDQIVDSVRFDGNPIFSGNTLNLGMGAGSRPLKLETSKLLTYGENSLKLSTTNATAEITVFETVDDVILNQDTSFTGISLSAASYIEGSNSALELDNTNYKVKIFFTGNNSAVEIRDRSGAIVERQEGINLSGEGREFVDFDVGVQLQIDKQPILGSLDELDFTTDDPVEVSSSILYRRLDSHTLRNDGSQTDTPDGASLLFEASLGNADTGQLSVSAPKLTTATSDSIALESGFYNMNIEYRGEDSYIRLTDALGRIRGFKFGVDLTGPSTSVDFDGGLSVSVSNSGWTENSSLQVPIEYNRRPPAIEEFDFRQYTEQIENAITAIDDELVKMQETAAQIQELNAQRNPNTQAMGVSAASLSASSSLNILSGGTSGPILVNASTSKSLAQAADQIFATTTAFATQANQTPEQLASLQAASAANILS
jgi:hypothetical protein